MSKNLMVDKIGSNINIIKVKRDKALIIDLECACWDGKRVPKGQRMDIIEIGVATYDFFSLAVEAKESIYIKPQNAVISDYCTDLTGITQEVLDEKGVTIEEAMKRLWKRHESNNRFWLSWGQEDRSFIYNDCKFYGVDNPMHIGHANVKDLFLSKYTRQFSLTTHNPSLTYAMQLMGMEFKGQAHSGLSDAYNTARLYKEILNAKR